MLYAIFARSGRFTIASSSRPAATDCGSSTSMWRTSVFFLNKFSLPAPGADVETQRLLIPAVIGLSAAQQIEYARIAEELEGLGFETEPFGNRTIAVKSAPAGLGAAEIEKVLFEILEIAESELRQTSLDDLRRAMAASIACRAAIKINMRLEPAKIDWLLRALAATSCPMSCPHGRPIALRYSTRDILKSFHRI